MDDSPALREGWAIFTAILTAAIETPLFWLAGYKDAVDCLHFAWINIVSNIILNQSMMELAMTAERWVLYSAVVIGEIFVVFLEFALSCCVMRGIGRLGLRRLLITVFFTNAASFIIGLVLMLL